MKKKRKRKIKRESEKDKKENGTVSVDNDFHHLKINE